MEYFGRKDMFNLDEQIIKWRDSLEKSNSLKITDIDELENHLRDEINELRESKLSEQEVFLIATRRLGQTDNLADEYSKINKRRIFKQKVSWMILGILIYLAGMYFLKFVVENSIRFAVHNNIIDYYKLGFIALGAQISAFLFMFLAVYFVYMFLLKFSVLKRINTHFFSKTFQLILLLIFLAAFITYRIVAYIPVPSFRGAGGIQTHIEQSLIISQMLWSLLLPAFLVMILIGLKSNFRECRN